MKNNNWKIKHVGFHNDKSFYLVDGPGWSEVSECQGNEFCIFGYTQKDAQLIAAAPNLLMACKVALEDYNEIENPSDIQRGIIALLEAAVRKAEGSTESREKFLFRLNDDGVAEWVVAETKHQAFEFADEMWGGMGKGEYFKEYLEDNPGSTFEEFIDYFVTVEDPEKLHTFLKNNGDRETKTVREWLEDETEVPSYFGCSEY